MKNNNRIISFFLCLALILSVAPISALAEDGDDLLSTSDLSTEELELIYDEDSYESEFASGQVIVGLNSSCDVNSFEDYINTILDVKEIREFMSREDGATRDSFAITLEDNTDQAVLDAIEKLKYDENIAYAEPNYTVYFCETPNDLDYSYQYNMETIQAPSAWDITTGSSEVKVGVIDSGVDCAHPDLAANIDDSLAYNVVTDTYGAAAVMDQYGHGTHVSGIIGAVGNNGIGITGVNWNVALVPIKVGDLGASVEAVIAAIEYAAKIELPIINLSLATYEYSQKFEDAINEYDGLVLTVAGQALEGGFDIDTTKVYPASFDCDNIISVVATTSTDEVWSYSNYGATTVDLGAPGEGIYSTLPGESYAANSGTSMAAPLVAGAAALLLSYNSNLTTAQLKDALLNSADKVSALDGKCVTGGRLNVYNALQYVKEDKVVYTFNDLKDALANPYLGTIRIGNNIEFTETLTIDRSVALVPYGQASITLTAASGLRHFNTSGSDIVIGLTGIILYGNELGGGINNTGKLTINGGTINGCRATNGGGIYNTGTLTISESIISANTATSSGGGICNAGTGTLTISVGAISGNTAVSGGGVFSRGTAKFCAGVICGNTARYGGGLYISNGTFTVSGGMIYSNKGTHFGGVCIFYGYGELIRTGGYILDVIEYEYPIVIDDPVAS